MDSDRDAATVELFQKFLRIKSTSHLGPKTGSYTACVALLEEEAKARGFETKVHEFVKGKPVLIASKIGTEPELPTILLNSHYDVVPVEQEKWICDAFEAKGTFSKDVFVSSLI